MRADCADVRLTTAHTADVCEMSVIACGFVEFAVENTIEFFVVPKNVGVELAVRIVTGTVDAPDSETRIVLRTPFLPGAASGNVQPAPVPVDVMNVTPRFVTAVVPTADAPDKEIVWTASATPTPPVTVDDMTTSAAKVDALLT